MLHVAETTNAMIPRYGNQKLQQQSAIVKSQVRIAFRLLHQVQDPYREQYTNTTSKHLFDGVCVAAVVGNHLVRLLGVAW